MALLLPLGPPYRAPPGCRGPGERLLPQHLGAGGERATLRLAAHAASASASAGFGFRLGFGLDFDLI